MRAEVRPAAGIDFDADVGVVVIGGGAAGLTAALSIGTDALVIERDAIPSGSTALSSGLIPAAATRFQAARAISDSHAAFAADISKKAGGSVPMAAIMPVVAAVGPALEWLGDAHGLPFEVIDDFTYPGHSALRMHTLPERTGRALIDRLRSAAEACDLPILAEATVDTLYRDGARIAGVGYTRPDGTRETVAARAVVLACNGYGGNRDLVARHIPSLRDALWFGHSGNEGHAVLWGEALGAGLRDLPGHQGHGSVAVPHGILITWATISEGGFQVNLDGRRFHDESTGYSEAAAPVVAEREQRAVTIFDARIAGIARQFADFRDAEAQGAIVPADDMATLAARMGLPADALEATLADVEALKRSGDRDRFGRTFDGVRALNPPYRAVKVTGALFHTQGGLAVDASARVLARDGTPFDNLFAAGGAAAGLSGPNASGYLSGNGLLTAVGLGRIAGLAAASLMRA